MVDHPDEFFTGMRDRNAVVLDFAAFLGKIFGKGIIPMTDIFLGKNYIRRAESFFNKSVIFLLNIKKSALSASKNSCLFMSIIFFCIYFPMHTAIIHIW